MNIKDYPESEYIEFVNKLISETASKINDANGQIDPIKKAIWEFVDIGYSSGLAAEEVVDFFCVSSDSVANKILHQTDQEREMVVYIFDQINYALFPKFFPDASG